MEFANYTDWPQYRLAHSHTSWVPKLTSPSYVVPMHFIPPDSPIAWLPTDPQAADLTHDAACRCYPLVFIPPFPYNTEWQIYGYTGRRLLLKNQTNSKVLTTFSRRHGYGDFACLISFCLLVTFALLTSCNKAKTAIITSKSQHYWLKLTTIKTKICQ